MNTLERVIRSKFLISKSYKRVYDFINLSDLSDLIVPIIRNMECKNVIEFNKLVTPFLRYISSLLKYEDSDLLNDKILIILRFPKSHVEFTLDMFKINDENEKSIREYMKYYNEGFHLIFTRKFDDYFIICNDSDKNDSYNQHINAKFKTEECLICVENKPNVLFCGCGHLCVCGKCIKYYESYECLVCKILTKILE